MTFVANPIAAAAPKRTLMQMPEHLAAMANTAKAKPSKFSQEGRRRRQDELTQRIYEIRNAELIRLRKLAEEKRIEEDKKRKALQLLRDAENLINEARGHRHHPMRFKRLLAILSQETGFTIEQILSSSRKAELVRARQFLYWIAHRNLHGRISIAAIGRYVGGRDHSTVLSGLKKINQTPMLLREAEAMEEIVLARELEIYGGELCIEGRWMQFQIERTCGKVRIARLAFGS